MCQVLWREWGWEGTGPKGTSQPEAHTREPHTLKTEERTNVTGHMMRANAGLRAGAEPGMGWPQ